jgi:hypothetical protein
LPIAASRLSLALGKIEAVPGLRQMAVLTDANYTNIHRGDD